MNRSPLPNLGRALPFALMLGLGASVAQADPGYYVVTPYDNAGLRTVELRYWTVKSDGRPEVVWPEVGLGYGVNSRWTTTAFVSYIGSSRIPMQLSSVNWQNVVLLTQGEWPVDLALLLQYVHDRSPAGQDAIEVGPLLQTDFGRTQFNANLVFDRPLGGAATRATELKYQWQLRHRAAPQWHYGAQGFGELGPWNHWAGRGQQSHRAGPALFGTWRLDDHEAIKAQAAILIGRTGGRSGHMFSLRAHYEF
jgi:hypothetical protein